MDYKKLIAELKRLPEAERIERMNALRLALHEISPFKNEPCDGMIWVPVADVVANAWNPNQVAKTEMDLLKLSVEADGYTMPVVVMREGEKYEVVDGYHRTRVCKEVKSVNARVKGYLPVSIIRRDREDKSDRMAATIRHNRARGQHLVSGMSDIVVELRRRNWSDEKIGRELGMSPDEVLRLYQVSGLLEMFKDKEFSEAWGV